MAVLKDFQRSVANALRSQGSGSPTSCSRCNTSASGRVDRSVILGEGSFKVVYKGEYTDGARKGQHYVSKELRMGPSYSDSVFQYELKIQKKAAQIIREFNEAKIIKRRVQLNSPEVWKFPTASPSRPDAAECRALVEPFISDFVKFNSNTGWVPQCCGSSRAVWIEAMQALSHFSYHTSGGKFLLCDLQGAVYKSKIVLTDPVVLSYDRRFGPTDLGRTGMDHFFHQHRCSAACNPAWSAPAHTAPAFPVREGTSMLCDNGQWIVPTRQSCPSPTLSFVEHIDVQ